MTGRKLLPPLLCRGPRPHPDPLAAHLPPGRAARGRLLLARRGRHPRYRGGARPGQGERSGPGLHVHLRPDCQGARGGPQAGREGGGDPSTGRRPAPSTPRRTSSSTPASPPSSMASTPSPTTRSWSSTGKRSSRARSTSRRPRRRPTQKTCSSFETRYWPPGTRRTGGPTRHIRDYERRSREEAASYVVTAA